VKRDQIQILVVDDEESMREFLSIMLHREGYRAEAVNDGAQALARIKEKTFDLIITDIQMPRVDGFELLKQVMKVQPETVVVMVTAFSTTEQAVEAMKQGAYDYITKPFKNDEIRLIVKNALERKALRQENLALKKELGKRESFDLLIGKSKAMQRVYDLIEKIAPSRVNVLLTGESGTGKEVVARAIHHRSERAEGPFVPINCGAIPENLLESELFGHEKGSFTGAIHRKEGLFEIANGGTLFLDEIGELPQMMQVKLLRVLQDQLFRRVGGTRDVQADVRLICATNRNLETAVVEGAFREDLFYRINVIRLELPPLRDRLEDIPLLVQHFTRGGHDGKEIEITEGALRKLLDYHWPGNIRELENVVERCLVLGGGEHITEDSLPGQFVGQTVHGLGGSVEVPDTGLDLDNYLAGIEREILLKALDKTGGVRKKAAELLGISFRSIRYRLAKFGLGDEDE